MLTIGKAASKFNLARSTLLYYERIGLLQPSQRTAAGYRLYSPADIRRLAKICFYRRTGVPLDEVQRLMDATPSTLRTVLEKRLADLNRDIQNLRLQEDIIVKLLGYDRLPSRMRGMDKQKWVALLRAAGLDEAQMFQWHVEFERLYPEDHHEFLAALGIAETEIADIRRWAKNGMDKPSKPPPAQQVASTSPLEESAKTVKRA